MEIKAKCKLDIDSVKALTRLSMFKKSNPKKGMIIRTVIYAILSLFVILELVFLNLDIGLFTLLVYLLCLGVFWYLFGLYLYFISSKFRYKALAKMKDAENEYIFCDDKIKISSKAEEYNSEGEVEYSLFVKVFETSQYFFLYQTKNQVLLVDKSTIEGGSAEDIRNKLSEVLKDKYIICKY